jgi:hypothetical protein
MAGPYLKSGESIILTTDRVLIDDVEYDLILTSHRLTLVDSNHHIDQPQVVPFDTIISVKGETTPAREPSIAIAVVDPENIDNEKTLKLIFTQQHYQDRSAECDLWVKKLIEHIVSGRNEPAPAGKQPVEVKPRETHATIRRFVAPEKLRPHMEVPQYRKPSEELLAALQKPAQEKEDLALDEPGQTERVETPAAPDLHKEQESSELTPIAESGMYDNHVKDKVAIQSEEKTGKPVLEVPSTELVPEPVMENEELSLPVIAEESSGINVPDPGKQKPVSSEPVDDIEKFAGVYADKIPGPAVSYGKLPEPEMTGEMPAEPFQNLETESPDGTGLPHNVVFPVLSGSHDQNEPPKTPNERSPSVSVEPSAQGMPKGKKRTGTLVAIVLVLLVVLGATAIIFLHVPEGMISGTHNTTVAPIITSPPVTTAILTSAIPPNGVWLKVTYNGTFEGSYGNPGPDNQQEVRGSGEQFYAIKNGNDLIQASFQKLDNSGNTLTVEIYNNGTMVKQFSKSSPKAEIDFLVDPTTGNPPFVPVRKPGQQ